MSPLQGAGEVAPVDLALGLGALVVVGIVVFTSARTSQAMAFLGLGVVMSLIWLRLGSVDVALAEAALGAGMLSALLVVLAIRGPDPPPHPRRWWVSIVGALCGLVITVVSVGVWLRVEQQLPAWSDPLPAAMPDGISHEITGVLLAFRSYDTLLESAVLMIAGITALTLGRDGGLRFGSAPAGAQPTPMRWMVRLTAPVLVLLGLWLLFAGSSGPGGAFQSGAVLAGTLILLHAGHVRLTRLSRLLRPLLVLGVVVFILAAGLGPAGGGAWLTWPEPWAHVAILTVEIVLTLGIAAGLYLLYLGLDDPAVTTLDPGVGR